MIVRQAFFEGSIHAGQEAAFRRFVETRLVPMWRQFPGLRDLRVMFALERDEGATPVPLALAMTFEDRAALDVVMTSAIRLESRAVTAELLQMFDGKVRHHVFELAGDQ